VAIKLLSRTVDLASKSIFYLDLLRAEAQIKCSAEGLPSTFQA